MSLLLCMYQLRAQDLWVYATCQVVHYHVIQQCVLLPPNILPLPSHFLPLPPPSSPPPIPPPFSPSFHLLFPHPLFSSLPLLFIPPLLLFSSFPLFLPPASGGSAQLTVTPLPDILFQNDSGVHNIVNQSVIWLYCTADSATATITWTKNGVTLVNDPAHIRIRSSNNSEMSTTSSLVVDNFQSPDNGNYECQARDGMLTTNSSTLSLTGGHCYEPTIRIHVSHFWLHGIDWKIWVKYCFSQICHWAWLYAESKNVM